MFAVLVFLIPVSLGGAVSPMMLTEQTVLLGTSGRRAANRFALGAVLTLLVIVLLLVFFGHVIELPGRPTLSASLDIVLGVALLGIAGLIQYLGAHPLQLGRSKRHAHDEKKQRSPASHQAAFPFGVFSMATNFTTLALVAVAAKEIAAADLDTFERFLLALVVVGICSTPAWAPLATTKLAPNTGQRLLDDFHRLITEHGRTAVVVLLVAAGVFLVARGVFNI